MSVPSPSCKSQRFSFDQTQKLGTTQYAFHELNKLKNQCKDILNKNESASHIGKQIVANSRGVFSNFTSNNNANPFMPAQNNAMISLPEINPFPISKNLMFREVFGNKGGNRVPIRVSLKPSIPISCKNANWLTAVDVDNRINSQESNRKGNNNVIIRKSDVSNNKTKEAYIDYAKGDFLEKVMHQHNNKVQKGERIIHHKKSSSFLEEQQD